MMEKSVADTRSEGICRFSSVVLRVESPRGLQSRVKGNQGFFVVVFFVFAPIISQNIIVHINNEPEI